MAGNRGSVAEWVVGSIGSTNGLDGYGWAGRRVTTGGVGRGDDEPRRERCQFSLEESRVDLRCCSYRISSGRLSSGRGRGSGRARSSGTLLDGDLEALIVSIPRPQLTDAKERDAYLTTPTLITIGILNRDLYLLAGLELVDTEGSKSLLEVTGVNTKENDVNVMSGSG